MRAPDDITIHRLQLHASARDAQAIAADLERSSWPLTETSRWVFVRALTLVADKSQVRHEAAQSLSRAMAGAVDGRTQGAEQAQAVHFETLPDLLASLVGDLLQGQASSKWYWRNWSYLWRETRPRAVLRLLWENAIYLPAVTALLAQNGHLALAWRDLGSDGTAQLVQELVRVCGLPSPADATPQERASAIETTLASHAAQCFQRHPSQLGVWQEPLSQTAPGGPQQQLAALVTGLQLCPLLVTRNTGAVVSAFARTLEGMSSRHTSLSPVPESEADRAAVSAPRPAPQSRRPSPGSWSEALASSISADEAALFPPVASASELSRQGADSVPAQADTLRPTRPVATDSVAKDTEASSDSASAASSKRSAPADDVSATLCAAADLVPAVDQPLCHTRSGGFFYLINALNHPECQTLWRRGGPELPNGWLWLLDTVQRLGGELDSALLALVAAQAGYAHVDELLDALPLRGGESVFDWLSEGYTKQGVWQSSLLDVPASVIASPSHIDVYYPLSAVSLPVRLAGLDLNPGWVPWLGRVLTFYYTEGGHHGEH